MSNKKTYIASYTIGYTKDGMCDPAIYRDVAAHATASSRSPLRAVQRARKLAQQKEREARKNIRALGFEPSPCCVIDDASIWCNGVCVGHSD